MIKALGGKAEDLFAPVKRFSEATRLFVTAMERRCDSRLMSVTGFDANDSRSTNKSVHPLPFWVFLGLAFGDKDAQERWVKGRELDCAIARPGILVTDPRSGHYKALIVPTR
ncbi:SDR family oxidoreductase [Alphaproteobacteria bacterium]|nr:SDR family oxidoreductase [Alphaproteobacteria bacterium]